MDHGRSIPPADASSSKPVAVDLPAIPDDLATCQILIRQLHEALVAAQRRNDQLAHRLAVLLKARFGPRADRLDPNQLTLFAAELVEKAAATVEPKPKSNGKSPTPPRNGHGRRRFPEDLPRVQVVHDLPEAEKPCPCCGQMRERIGQETHEQLELKPAELYVLQHIRPTYACKHCQGQVTTASKPAQPIEKGLAGPSLMAHVIVCKFGDHQPLYRQEASWARSGQALPRSTVCGWLGGCGNLLTPLHELMAQRVLQSKAIHTDDTPVPVLEPGRGKTREGRIWVYVGDKDHPYTVFDYTATRSREGPAKFFGDYAGYIQADAYGGYDHLFKPKPDGKPSPTELACWAHARRYFVEAEHADALRSCMAVAMIGELYAVETEAKDWNAQDRRALRQEKSVPQLAKIHAWLNEQKDQVLPKSPIGTAINYCLGNWEALIRYTEDGDLAIDNNAAENAIRPIVLGRKNWLFAGSDNGGRTGAILASLVASCKRHGVDPFAYLKDVLTRIAETPLSQLDQFLPDRWKAARTSPPAG
jgi:transposase